MSVSSASQVPGLPWSEPLEGLPLRTATPREWIEVALADLDALLVDHAHCEQKAASMAMALIGRFPDHPGLARGMIALAHEEMRHFRQVLDRIEARGATLTKPLPDRYVRSLREWSFRHPGGTGALGDALLVSAFVEARSCERFRLLAEGLLAESGPDAVGLDDARGLGIFYLRLADAEGRHWELFRDLAKEAGPEQAIEERLQAMAAAEAEIMAERSLEPRMH
jgi:tRNA-(ms[2]io[6]A)-hydroxylase